ncbi:MAG: hypothetical protein QXP98_10215 [Thermoproteus sp.]
MSRRDRVNIAVSIEVAQRLAKASESTGMTQYALANDIMSLGLDLLEEGYNLQQMRNLARFWRVCLDIEAVPVPASLLDKLITRLYSEHSDLFKELWCEAGRTLAAYFKATSTSGVKEAVQLMQYLGKILPAKRFEARQEDGVVTFSVVGVGYSRETIEVNAAAVRCFFESLGYKVAEVDIESGVLYVRAAPSTSQLA